MALRGHFLLLGFKPLQGFKISLPFRYQIVTFLVDSGLILWYACNMNKLLVLVLAAIFLVGCSSGDAPTVETPTTTAPARVENPYDESKDSQEWFAWEMIYDAMLNLDPVEAHNVCGTWEKDKEYVYWVYSENMPGFASRPVIRQAFDSFCGTN